MHNDVMTELLREDERYCVKRLPKNVRQLMMDVKDPKLVLAGGFLRSCIANEHINDVDFFCESKEQAWLYATQLANMNSSTYTGPSKKNRISESGNAFTVRNCYISVQFVHRWTFESAFEVIQSFDYTIAMVCMWREHDKWWTLCSPRFYADLAARRLIYTHPKRNEDAGGSLLRAVKFLSRGYRIPLNSLSGVIARMTQGVDVEQFPGLLSNEAEMTRQLCGLMNEVDPNVLPMEEFLKDLKGDS